MAAFFYLLPDEPPPPDDDLRHFRREVPESTNGFLVVNVPKDEVFWPDADEENEDNEDEREGSESFDARKALEILEKNALILEKLKKSLQSPDFQGPEAMRMDDRVPYLSSWRLIADVVSRSNRFFLESGRDKEAVDGALQLLHFGNRIEGAQGSLIVWLVGSAIQKMGVSDLLRLLPRTKLGSRDLKPHIDELSRYSVRDDGLRDAFRAEYAVLSNTFEKISEGDPYALEGLSTGFTQRILSKKPFFKPNQAKRFLLEDLRKLIVSVSRPAAERDPLDVITKYGEARNNPFGNPLARILLQMLLPTYEKALSERDALEVSLSGARILLALKCFQLDRGHLPESLHDLVPDYLSEIPRDPFDGRPLRYSPVKKIIYSVGADLEDEGGSDEKDAEKARSDRNEPTLRIDF